MAAKSIEFTISAVDRATAVIKRVNDNIDRMKRPYADLAKSAKAFAQASGLANVSKNLGNVATQADKAARSILKMGAPLLTIVGGGTLAGLSEMVTHWERIGAETERTSRLLGITANQLTQMRSAATLMGGSADAMTAGFQSLQDTLQDARWGRNQAAFATLQALGIQLHTTKTGAVDTQAAMYDLADRMKQIQQRDPAAARNLARQLGVEQLLPMLIQGREGMQKYEAEAKRLRGEFTPDMAKRAQDFTHSLGGLGLALDGLKASIADRLAPILGPFVDKIANWIAQNRALISQRVGALVERIASALNKVDLNKFADGVFNAIDSLMDFASWILRIIDHIGGFKTVAMGFALYMGGSFVASIGKSIGSIAMLAWRIGKLVRAWRTAGDVATTSAKAMERAAEGGGTVARIGRAARAVGGLKAGLKAGGIAEGIAGAVEIGGVLMSNESAAQKKHDVSGAAGATIGGVAGSALGGAIGSVLLPGIGTYIGMSLGGLAGESIGRWIGNAAGDAMFGKAKASGKQPGKGAEDTDSDGDNNTRQAKGMLAQRVVDAADVFAQKVSDAADDFANRMGGIGSGIAGGAQAAVSGVTSAASAAASAGKGISRGIRNNNPGNIEYGPYAKRMGAIGSDGRFAIFPSMQQGSAAMLGLIKGYRSKGIDTISGIVSRYAPSSENNTAAYIAAVAKRTGINPAAHLSDAQYASVQAAMAVQESGYRGGPVPSLNPPPVMMAQTAPPVVNVSTAVHVARDGSASVRTQTPNGLHIANSMPSATG